MSLLHVDHLLRTREFRFAEHPRRIELVRNFLVSHTPTDERAREYRGCTLTQETRLQDLLDTPANQTVFTNEVDIIGWTKHGDVVVDWFCDTLGERLGSTYLLIERNPDQFGHARELGLGHGPSAVIVDPAYWPDSIHRHAAFIETPKGQTQEMVIDMITMKLHTSDWPLTWPPRRAVRQQPQRTLSDVVSQMLADLNRQNLTLFERDYDALAGPIVMDQEIPSKPGQPVTPAWLAGLLPASATPPSIGQPFAAEVMLYAQIAGGPYRPARLTAEGTYPAE